MDNSKMSYPLPLLINEQTQKHIDSISYFQARRKASYGYAYFVICGSCHWCASNLADSANITKCPGCSEDNIESIPLALGEKYSFDFDKKHGIVLDFARIWSVKSAYFAQIGGTDLGAWDRVWYSHIEAQLRLLFHDAFKRYGAQLKMFG